MQKTDEEHMQNYHPEPNSGCWLWLGNVANHGYGRFCRRKGKRGKIQTFWVHRFSYQFHKGPIPDGLMVRHKCDVKICINPDHLELGTAQDNMDDMKERNRSAKNEKCARTKYSNEEVRQIRLINGWTLKEIAKLYKMTASNVWFIRKSLTRKLD